MEGRFIGGAERQLPSPREHPQSRGTNGATWTSTNTAVATMDSSVKGLVDGVAAGTASIEAQVAGDTYQYTKFCVTTPVTRTGSTAATVQKPTFLKLVKSTTTTTCSGQSCLLEVWCQVLDVNSNPINMAGLQIVETVAGTHTGNCTGSLQDLGKWSTDATGTMTGPDYWWWCCSQSCNATYSFNQGFTVNGYGVQILSGSYVGSHNVVTVQCKNGQGSCPTVVPTP